jgi:hypothetical protein
MWGDVGLDGGAGGMDLSSASSADGRFSSNAAKVNYAGSGGALDKTTLLIGGVILLSVVFLWGRK